MSIEDLMKPRYKVIADYPADHPYTSGEILEDESGFTIPYKGNYKTFELSDYPHLFKKLEWWEDRKPEDMPEYVKATGRLDSFDKPLPDWYLKVKKHFNAGNGEWRDNSHNIFCAYPDKWTIGISMNYCHFEPATEWEYNAWLNKEQNVQWSDTTMPKKAKTLAQ